MNEPDANVTPLLRPPLAPIRSKRLSIAELFLITFGAAIAIWILQPPAGQRTPQFVAVSVLMAPLYGSAVATVFLAIYQAALNLDPFAIEPGHWLLLIIGTAFFGAGVASRIVASDFLRTTPLPLVLFLAAICMLCSLLGLFSIAIIVAAIYANDHQPLRWRLVFRLIGWTLLLGVVGALFLPAGGFTIILLPLVMLTSPVLLLVATIAAVAIDLWERTYRDHWHWLGVATFLGLPTHVVLLIIAEQFSQ